MQIAVIAAKKGFVSTEEDVISIGKWDTALIIKPETHEKFSDPKVREVIWMPR